MIVRNQNLKYNYFNNNLVPEEITLKIYNLLLNIDSSYWRKNTSFREQKKSFFKLEKVNSLILNATEAFHDSNVIKKIEKITCIENLEADPSLYAGGISMMSKGDFLNPTSITVMMPKKKYRGLNLLFYISPNWKESIGGNLELWDEKINKKITITSKFNRLVVMKTNKHSWYSVSKLKINQPRCCISNYYFTRNSPEKYEYYHVTSFNGRPEEKVKRIYSYFDNFLRQKVSSVFNISRGKSLVR
ncbi:hypothetical protein OAO44_00960, partial [Candidatus Pelagibacter sp.]|nr:hypothetical protein [Candidatus Pelagibacter sp.]